MSTEIILALMERDDGENCLVYTLLIFNEIYTSIEYHETSKTWFYAVYNNYQDYYLHQHKIEESDAIKAIMDHHKKTKGDSSC